ncbi:MAG TPA: extracellular solute-binding protein [Thermohalobaculum sp.]|nr:extracellular solute-binding protein [Thermohalobaculum sp.]
MAEHLSDDKSLLARMLRKFRLAALVRAVVVLASTLLAATASAQPTHGLAMHGEPVLDKDFKHLPYANPEAPKGGTAVFGETGSFDSLNPYVLKGRAPWGVREHVVESLMARSWDEPFALYGLLAESVEVPEDRSWVEFTLNPDARFSDGSPVTVEDVIWSLETLGTQGHPRYRNSWGAVESVEAVGERGARISFNEPNRELPMIFGLRPVLKRAQFEGRDFADATDVEIIGSGPYTIGDYESGRFIEFERDPDHWGADLGVSAGLNNFDTIRYEYFRNADALWEAVKSGGISIFNEYDPVRWAEGYTFPAAVQGEIVKGEIEHGRPTGMYGFVFNTRRAPFEDRRVREALALTLDWEWVNERLFRNQYARIQSYFDNSPLAWEGEPGPAEAEILAASDLPGDAAMEGWRPPESEGTGRDRRNLRRAMELLNEAGWQVEDGVLVNGDGKPFAFEILVGSTEEETLASLWAEGLSRLGIRATVRRVDDAQYVERRRSYDYDVTVNRWFLSLSPGTEQRLYFGSTGREEPGSRNYMGVDDPAVDTAIDALLAAETREGFEAAAKALDRVLSAGIYVIPLGVLPTDRVAWKKGFAKPEQDALYGWRPEVWWKEE